MGKRIFVLAVLIFCFSLTSIPGFGQPVKEQTTTPPAIPPASKPGGGTTEFKAAETAPKPNRDRGLPKISLNTETNRKLPQNLNPYAYAETLFRVFLALFRC